HVRTVRPVRRGAHAFRRSRERTARERLVSHDATRTARPPIPHRAVPRARRERAHRRGIAQDPLGIPAARESAVPRDRRTGRPLMTSVIGLPYEMFTLDNGLRVVVHVDRRAPLVCTNIWYHVGSKEEEPGRTGFAHLFEHLMFEGSEHVPEGAFDDLLEQVGAVNNGSTSTDRTNYWALMPSHALDLALYLEADRMGGLLPAITSA